MACGTFEESETYRLLSDNGIKKRHSNACVAVRIPVTELCERLTWHSIAANLVMFCTNSLKLNSVDAVTVSLVFMGTCYFFPPFGGWIADSFAGQYNTILASLLLHMLGTFFLPASAFIYSSVGPYEMPLVARTIFFLIGLFLVALATGGLKANFSPFGASQVEHSGPNAVQTFFYWYYWCISVGAMIAYTAVVYVEQEVGFGLGYLIPALTMLLAVIVFVTAKNQYVVVPPKGSQIETTLKIMFESVKNKYHQVRLDLPSFLDYAKIQYGGSRPEQEVEDVKQLGGVMPIFIIGIVFWVNYAQLNSSYLLQAERMNLQLGSFVLPAASLHIFLYIVIIFVVPVLDRLVYPFLDRCWKRPTPLVRMGLGFFFSGSSLIVAGLLEYYRKEDIEKHGTINQNVGGNVFQASHLGVLYQIPQFLLAGMGHVFMEITALEFAFKEAPVTLKAVVTGVFMITIGLGQYIGSLLVIIVNAATSQDPWYPDEINNGHIDNFFYLLGALEFTALIIFTILAMRYKYAENLHVPLTEESDPSSSPPHDIPDISLHSNHLGIKSDSQMSIPQIREKLSELASSTEF